MTVNSIRAGMLGEGKSNLLFHALRDDGAAGCSSYLDVRWNGDFACSVKPTLRCRKKACQKLFAEADAAAGTPAAQCRDGRGRKRPTAIFVIDAELTRADASARSTANALEHSLRDAKGKAQQRETAERAKARADALLLARADVAEIARCSAGLLLSLDLKHPAKVINNWRASLRNAVERVGGAT